MKLKFPMPFLNREACSLSRELSRLHDEVVILRNQRVDSTIMISRLEAKLRDSKGRLKAREDSIIRDLKAKKGSLVRDIIGLRELS
nr:hypothetical protein [Tanacetum cinerariifolium]